MFSYRFLKAATMLMCFGIGALAGSLILLRVKDERSRTFFLYASPVVAVLSAAALIFLCFRRESFHWFYDIATGVPVDHYSTYGKCVLFSSIAVICSLAASAIGFLSRRKNAAGSDKQKN